MQKPTFNLGVVRVPCIGRVDPVAILEILLKGVTGVLVIGCASPDCHFTDGNVYAERTIEVLKKLLALARLEPERVELRSVSPMEEARFVSIVREFAAKLKKVGASPLIEGKRDTDIYENVLAAKNAFSGFLLKAFIGKAKELTHDANAYNERISPEEFDTHLKKVVEAEFIRHRILLTTQKKPLSVKELANSLRMKPAVVFRHIMNMRRAGTIALDSVEGRTPLYKALEAR